MPEFKERIPSLCPNCGCSVDSVNHEGFCSEACFFKVYPHGLGQKIGEGGGMSVQNEVALNQFNADVKELEEESGFSWAVLKERFGTDNVVAARARWEALNGENNVANIQLKRGKSQKGKKKSVSDDYAHREVA